METLDFTDKIPKSYLKQQLISFYRTIAQKSMELTLRECVEKALYSYFTLFSAVGRLIVRLIWLWRNRINGW